jgi:neutral ceramidase
MRKPILLAFAAACAVLPSPAATAWRVGLAQTKITPSEPLPLAGYAGRTGPFRGVEADIFAKALALDDGAGRRALLITSDCLGWTGRFTERLCARIVKATGLPREAILVSASHTHTAPVVAPEMNWPPGGEFDVAIDRYLANVENAMVRMGSEALGSMRPANLAWGWGIANFVMNRREATPRGVVLGVNPSGYADRRVPVLRVESQGRILAIVFGAAAHAVASAQSDRVSGDYPGFAQIELQRLYPGAQAMFMAGAAGDANAHPKTGVEDARVHGQTLAAEVARVLGGRLQPVNGPLVTLLERADLPLRRITPDDLSKFAKSGWEGYFVEGAKAIFAKGGAIPPAYRAPFAMWRFGDGLTLVGLSGEPVSDFSVMSSERLGPLDLWVAGYTNDVYGYLASERVLQQGGYETRGLYIGIGLFDAGVDRAVMEAIESMGRKAGRIAAGR